MDKDFQNKLCKGLNDLTLKLNEINKFHICTNCKNANPIGNYFCLECGEKLVEDATVTDDSNQSETGSKSILYYIEVLKNDKIIERVSVTQSEILIGRESSKCVANIRLYTQNFHISSSHLYLVMNKKGDLYARILTDNQTLIDGKQPLKNEELHIHKNSEIKIYEFALRFAF